MPIDVRTYTIRKNNGEEQGPLDAADVVSQIKNKTIHSNDEIKNSDSTHWEKIGLHPDFKHHFIENEDKTIVRGITKEPKKSEFDDDKTVIRENDKNSTLQVTKMPHKRETIFVGENNEQWKGDGYTSEIVVEGKNLRGKSIDEGISEISNVSNEKTEMFEVQKKKENLFNKLPKKKKLLLTGLIIALVYLLLDSDEGSNKNKKIEFNIELPIAEVAKSDSSKSNKLQSLGIKEYWLDTPNGYKKASSLFLKASNLDSNNLPALCFLVSSYINVFDSVEKNEKYFGTINRLMEMIRAKNIDLVDLVIADTEFYLMLGNPDAAIQRIIEFSKNHSFGAELYFYIALSYYQKGDYDNSFRYLSHIQEKEWLTPRIPYLYGLLLLKMNKTEEARRALITALKINSTHIHSRVELMELDLRLGKHENAKKYADFIIENATQATKDERARAYFARAKLYTLAKNDDSAVKEIETALKLRPEDPDYKLEYYFLKSKTLGDSKEAQKKAKMYDYVAKGDLDIKSENVKGAIANYLTARQADDTDPLPLVKLSEAYEITGDMKGARTSMDKAVKLLPSKSENYPRLIHLMIRSYEFEEAKKIIERYKTFDVPQAQLDLLYAEYYYRSKNYIRALGYMKRSVSSSGAGIHAYLLYAEYLFETNQFSDASFNYGMAFRFDPYNVTAVIGIAKSIAQLESTQKGAEYLASKIQMFPIKHRAKLLNGLAELFYLKGNYAEALKANDEAITASPGLPINFKTKAEIYLALDKRKESLDAYITYNNLAPQDPQASIQLYHYFMKLGNYSKAKESIEKLILQYPKYPGAYYLLGVMFQKSGNLKSAIQAALKEVKNNPEYILGHTLVASIYYDNRNYDEALFNINKALEGNPNNVEALILAGSINRALRAYAAAESQLNRARSLDSGNPEVYKGLGLVFLENGKTGQAKAYFKAYLDRAPDAPAAEREKYLKYINEN